MRPKLLRRVRLVRLLVSVLVLAAVIVQAPVALADTPTLGSNGYHCQSSPQLCRTNWAGPNTYIGFLIINNTLQQRDVWKYGIETARQRWTAAPGPQWMTNSDTGGLGWNYFEFSWSGDHFNTDQTYAVTWFCPDPSAAPCYSGNQPANIRWASIWMNSTTLDKVPGQQFDSTATHELGHTLGLWHHADDGRLSVMAPNGTASRTDTPQGDDIGNTNWCSFPPPGGVRCIFRSNGSY